ncbi:MAG: hypothetical protein ACREUZ_03880 [Burkholderiales bacterium]
MTFSSVRRSVGATAAVAVPVIVAVLATSTPSAQSLGEVAAREARRRQEVGAGKRYTAEDLPADSGSAPPPNSSAAQPEAAKAPVAADTSTEPTPAGDTPPPRELRDEKYWRMRAKEIRTKMEEIHSRVKALEGRVAELGDSIEKGAGSAASREREVSERALKSAREDAEGMKGEWDRFEARARLKNVPADWLQ